MHFACSIGARPQVLLLPSTGTVRIRHPWRNSSSPVAPAHRSHIARRKAGHAPAGSNAQLRGTVPAAHRSPRARSLRLNREQLSLPVPCHAHAHPGHIVCNEKCLLFLNRELRALTCSCELNVCRFYIQSSAVCRGSAGIISKLLPHRVNRRIGNRARCRRGFGLVACRQNAEHDREKNQGSFHGKAIVNPSARKGVYQYAGDQCAEDQCE